jgi:hypothetical protein
MGCCEDEQLKTEFIGFHFHRIQHFEYLLVSLIQLLELIGTDILTGPGELQPGLGLSRFLHRVAHFAGECLDVFPLAPSFSRLTATTA